MQFLTHTYIIDVLLPWGILRIVIHREIISCPLWEDGSFMYVPAVITESCTKRRNWKPCSHRDNWRNSRRKRTGRLRGRYLDGLGAEYWWERHDVGTPVLQRIQESRHRSKMSGVLWRMTCNSQTLSWVDITGIPPPLLSVRNHQAHTGELPRGRPGADVWCQASCAKPAAAAAARLRDAAASRCV